MNIRQQEPQFVSAFIFGGNPNLNAFNSHDFEREAREHVDQTAAQAIERGVQVEALIIDTYRRAVETLNGADVNLFSKALNDRYPDWHLGDVDEPLNVQDTSEKILEAFENPEYQSLSDTPEIIEFVVINYPYTYDEELKRLIEREKELAITGGRLKRYLILFSQPSEKFTVSQMSDVADDVEKAELTNGINLDEYNRKFKKAYQNYAELKFHSKLNAGKDVSFEELDEAKKIYSELVHLTLEALINEKNFEKVFAEFYKAIVETPFLRLHKDWFTMFLQHLKQDVVVFQLENRHWEFPIRWKLTSVVPH